MKFKSPDCSREPLARLSRRSRAKTDRRVPPRRDLARQAACTFMKTNIRQLFIIGASVFLLAGCCTTQHVTRWEYKAVPVVTPSGPEWQPTEQKKEEALMNDLGKEGWIFVSKADPFLYFKRPVK